MGQYSPCSKLKRHRLNAFLVLGKEVIIIVHHMKTVVSTDKIVVLDNGVVSGLGTQAELMKKAVARMGSASTGDFVFEEV